MFLYCESVGNSTLQKCSFCFPFPFSSASEPLALHSWISSTPGESSCRTHFPGPLQDVPFQLWAPLGIATAPQEWLKSCSLLCLLAAALCLASQLPMSGIHKQPLREKWAFRKLDLPQWAFCLSRIWLLKSWLLSNSPVTSADVFGFYLAFLIALSRNIGLLHSTLF